MNFEAATNNNSKRSKAESGKMSVSKKIKLEPSSKSSDENSNEESNFNELIDRVCEIIKQTTKMNDSNIFQALSNIKKSFPEYDFTSIDFNNMENLYAYFVHYSPLNVALSRNRFLNAIKNCEKLRNRINNLNVNVISLGGGPGTDIIGFCSALQECSEKSNTLLDLTVVDLWPRWASFYDAIKSLLREGNYGYASRLFQQNNVNTSFIEADIRGNEYPKKYIFNLKNADIVLLVRVLDVFNKKRDNPDIIFKNIAEKMKKNAFLLLVDTRARYQESALLEKIYSSDLEEFVLKNFPDTKISPYLSYSSKAEIAVFKKN